MKVLILIAFLLPTMLFAQQTYVPDDNFEQYLIDRGWDEGPLNDSVPTANIENIDELVIKVKNISDLTGIEDFISLQFLDCNYNNIKTLNLSNNIELYYIDCSSNQLTELNISSNLKLFFIDLNGNNLGELDFSQHINLEYLDCSWNRLISLNIKNGQPYKLSYFNAEGNLSLQCIQVGNPNDAEKNQNWHKEPGTIYSHNCSTIDVPVEPTPTFSISPNPATEFINIDTESLTEEIEIYNMLGIPVLKTIGSGQIDVSGLPRGVYFVKVSGRTERVVLY